MKCCVLYEDLWRQQSGSPEQGEQMLELVQYNIIHPSRLDPQLLPPPVLVYCSRQHRAFGVVQY